MNLPDRWRRTSSSPHEAVSATTGVSLHSPSLMSWRILRVASWPSITGCGATAGERRQAIGRRSGADPKKSELRKWPQCFVKVRLFWMLQPRARCRQRREEW